MVAAIQTMAAVQQQKRKRMNGLITIGGGALDIIMGFLHPVHVLQLSQTSNSFWLICTGKSGSGSAYWWDVLNLPAEAHRYIINMILTS
jgi:hypothetical protein